VLTGGFAFDGAEIMRLQGSIGRVIQPLSMEEIPEADDDEQQEEPRSSGSRVEFQTRESAPCVREMEAGAIEVKQRLYIPVDQYPNVCITHRNHLSFKWS
jgi:hypothetical protein